MIKRVFVLFALLAGVSAGVRAQGTIVQKIIVKVNGEIRALLDGVSARLTNDTLTYLVGQVVIDGLGIRAVARGFLSANGLL